MKKSKENSGKKMFAYDGNFYTYTGKIFDLLVVSVYWLLGCIPVVTIGASFSALYAAVTKSVRYDRDTISSQFWKAYKQNLIPSIPLTLIYGGGDFYHAFKYRDLRRKNRQSVGAVFHSAVRADDPVFHYQRLLCFPCAVTLCHAGGMVREAVLLYDGAASSHIYTAFCNVCGILPGIAESAGVFPDHSGSGHLGGLFHDRASSGPAYAQGRGQGEKRRRNRINY